MKWMNFIPLLVWSLVFPALIEWGKNNTHQFMDAKNSDSEIESCAKFYVCGLFFWLILGALLSL